MVSSVEIDTAPCDISFTLNTLYAIISQFHSFYISLGVVGHTERFFLIVHNISLAHDHSNMESFHVSLGSAVYSIPFNNTSKVIESCFKQTLVNLFWLSSF